MKYFLSGISYFAEVLSAFRMSYSAVRAIKNFNKKLCYFNLPIVAGERDCGVGYGKEYADRFSAYGRDKACRC
ncbi:hypothetical protein FACS189472_03610 [Alphaproteobacteria bacterium]|nr:hypothetical protein FACS189472_03610 [Alphaproteobacteria bacterium]